MGVKKSIDEKMSDKLVTIPKESKYKFRVRKMDFQSCSSAGKFR